MYYWNKSLKKEENKWYISTEFEKDQMSTKYLSKIGLKCIFIVTAVYMGAKTNNSAINFIHKGGIVIIFPKQTIE